MIRDLSEATPAAPLTCDLCIIGTGPAGMTLARELADSGLRIVVLESGKLQVTRHADALRAVRSEGIRIKDYSRERVLGGASTAWAGLSAPLDPIDFSERPWLALPGWPIARDELLPYWAAAAERFRFAAPSAYGPDGFGALKRRGDAQLAWHDVEEKIFLAASEPQDFGREHKRAFDVPNVDLWLDATVLRLEGAAPGTDSVPRIARAVVRTSTGRELSVEAKAFVLAGGGIENARLLLASRDVCAAGLGNERDMVGRGFMNHPKNYHGLIRLAKPVRELPYHFGCLHRGFAGYAGLRLTEPRQRERGLMNSYVRFEPVFPWTDSRGVEAFVFLVKRSRGLFRGWKERRREQLVTLRDYSETGDDTDLQNERKSFLGWLGLVGLVVVQLPTVLRYVAARLRRSAPLVRTVRLRNFMEMEPHPENRILLGDARDGNGQPLPVVRHAPTELDRRSLIVLHDTLAAELRASGFGELETSLALANPWPIDQDASHHMGATRMGHDPATSVVNRDLRLHGAANVYAAGASVFPTSGCANPTLTIVALSIRLAEHLRDVLGAAPAAAAAPVTARAVPPPRPRAAGGPPPRRVIVVGAGKRVQTDVLPVLERMACEYELAGVFARGGGTIRSRTGADHRTRALDELTADELLRCDLVYLAVSKGAVPDVLAALARHDVSRTDLLVETPVLLLKHLRHAARLAAFRNTWVAEDCSTLPWLGLVQQAARGPLGELREVICDRSAYRYHGLALIKTLLGSRAVLSARRARLGEGATRVDLRLAGGGRGVMIEPRDYPHGVLTLVGASASASDGPGAAGGAGAAGAAGAPLRLEPVVGPGGFCAGFRLGDLRGEIDDDEAALIGPLRAGESVTARMEDMKRAGLLRLLRAVHAGRGGYPLEEGLDDMAVDFLLEKAGRFRATALTSVKSPLGRSLLGAVGSLARG